MYQNFIFLSIKVHYIRGHNTQVSGFNKDIHSIAAQKHLTQKIYPQIINKDATSCEFAAENHSK